jgi:hypothetical protein
MRFVKLKEIHIFKKNRSDRVNYLNSFEKANIFNKFLSGVGEKISNSIESIN